MMKRIIVLLAVITVVLLAWCPCLAQEVASADTAESVAENTDIGENSEEFDKLLTELYGHWQNYTATEGDNAFEKAVNFAWKYRGDIGGVAAAVAVTVLLLVMVFRFMPAIKRYFDYIYKGNAMTRDEMLSSVRDELSRYAPALSTVEQVAELYPAFKELVDKLISENSELKTLVTNVGEGLAETERRHAAEMKLQGETFRDIISLSAIPAGRKAEILDSYRAIILGANAEGKEE